MKELVRGLLNYFGTRRLLSFILIVLREEGLKDTSLYYHLAEACKAQQQLNEFEISKK